MAYMKHIVLYHWSLCACIVIGCVIRVYIGSCVATSQSGYLILYFVRTYVTYGASFNFPLFFICKIYRTFEADPIRLLLNVLLIITYYVA